MARKEVARDHTRNHYIRAVSARVKPHGTKEADDASEDSDTSKNAGNDPRGKRRVAEIREARVNDAVNDEQDYSQPDSHQRLETCRARAEVAGGHFVVAPGHALSHALPSIPSAASPSRLAASAVACGVNASIIT